MEKCTKGMERRFSGDKAQNDELALKGCSESLVIRTTLTTLDKTHQDVKIRKLDNARYLQGYK